MGRARPKEAVPPNLLAGDGTPGQPDPEPAAEAGGGIRPKKEMKKYND